jgi:hypothetical protein
VVVSVGDRLTKIRAVRDDSGMAETRDELQHHLQALEEFESKYRAYVEERKRQPAEPVHLIGRNPIHTDNGRSTDAEMETRKNELLELGPAVDEALVVAGVGPPRLGHPPAIGGGLMAEGVTSLMFNHGPVGLDVSGFGIPNLILEKVVAAKGALKRKLKRRPSAVGEAIRQRAQEPRPPGNLVPAQEAAARQGARDEEPETPKKSWRRGFLEGTWKALLAFLIALAAIVAGALILGNSSDGGRTSTAPPAQSSAP